MKVAIISVYTDHHRRGDPHRGILQPQVGPLIAALLPDTADITVVNDTWTDPDWSAAYDLVFLSCMHSDFDRARQISHYYRRRGARTVLGGIMASTYPALCAPWFDAVVVGDPEDTVPRIYRDALANTLQPIYRSGGYDGAAVPTPHVRPSARQQLFPVALEATRGCPFTCDFCALTAAGTRFKTRPVESVVRDIVRMQQDLDGEVSAWRRRLVMFYDNNLAGNLTYFRVLCAALKPMNIRWGTCVTFNVLTKRDLLRQMYESGCRTVFVGLESFNPAAIEGFNNHQNRLQHVRRALADARAEGIVVTAGLMLSPVHDDIAYIRSLPERLQESGLHVPAFVCIETAIPGTPLFRRMAATPDALLPDATLPDFNAYSLTMRPRKASPEDFVAAYRDVLRAIYSVPQRAGKLWDDLPRLLRRGAFASAALDVVSALGAGTPVVPGRSYLPGTDIPPQETVPFAADDFRDEAEYQRLLQPTRVTDASGRVLAEWRDADSPFTVQRLRPVAVAAR